MQDISTAHALDRAQMERKLKALTEEISVDLAQLEASQSKQLLSSFVSELFFSVAEQCRKKERRQKQAEGIAKAKAKGVRFGPAARPLPESFSECYRAWQDGTMTVVEAAAVCGISRNAFYRGAARMKENEDRFA